MSSVTIRGSKIKDGEIVFAGLNWYDEERIDKNKRAPYLPLGAQYIILDISGTKVFDDVEWDKYAQTLYSYIAIQLIPESIANFTKIDISPNLTPFGDYLFIPDSENPMIINARYRRLEPLQCKFTSFVRYPFVPLDMELLLRK